MRSTLKPEFLFHYFYKLNQKRKSLLKEILTVEKFSLPNIINLLLLSVTMLNEKKRKEKKSKFKDLMSDAHMQKLSVLRAYVELF